jgi:hypothetical protein
MFDVSTCSIISILKFSLGSARHAPFRIHTQIEQVEEKRMIFTSVLHTRRGDARARAARNLRNTWDA